MTSDNCAVILAGGRGKRMGSELPKVMCEVLGKPMIDYAVGACMSCVHDVCVVIGYKGDVIKAHLGESVRTAYQEQQLGTGHAVMMAEDFIRCHDEGNVLILCGDNPLMDSETLESALRLHVNEDNAITVITAKLDDPASYGRIVKENGSIAAIVEAKDADPTTLAINEINSGAYWFKASVLLELLGKIGCDNAQGEYYLTDTVKLAIGEGERVNSYISPRADVVMGANDPAQLEELNKRAALYY